MATELTIEHVAHERGMVVLARMGTNAVHVMLAAPNVLGSWDVRTLCGRTLGSSRDAEIEMDPNIGGKRCKRCDVRYMAMLDVQEKAGENSAPEARESAPKLLDVAAIQAATVQHYATGGEIPDGVTHLPGTDADDAPAVRELTDDDVRNALRTSKRGAVAAARAAAAESRAVAVERERERLAARKAQRAAAREAAVATDVVSVNGLTHTEMREQLDAWYAAGNPVSPEVAALPDPHVQREWSGTVAGADAAVLVCEFTGGVEMINPERTHGKCPECTTYIPLAPESDAREVAPKVSKITCGSVGEPPKPGTRVMRDDHSVSVPDDFDGKHSGKCPGCSRMVAVSREGGMRRHNGIETPAPVGDSPDRIGKHNVGGVATPAGKGLTSKSIETVEHGNVPGDTATADKRRGDESRCKRSNRILKDASGGKVPCPACERPVELLKITRPNGDISWKVPNHVRPGESVRHVGGGEVRDVTPRGDGADVGATVSKGARLALSRGQGSTDGSAYTGQSTLAPVQPEKGWLAVAGTGALSMSVRAGIDPEVSGEYCPVCRDTVENAHKGKGRTWRRKHSRRVRLYIAEQKAERDARTAREIRKGERLPQGARKAARKSASTGSFTDGTIASTGTVTHGAERPAVAPKVTPRGKTRATAK